MEKTCFAHKTESGQMQTVAAHLEGTAKLCQKFAAAFQAGEQGYMTGLLHDIGKYSDAFQKRLLANGKKVDHATAGAIECSRHRQPIAAFCIAGHHSGLLDGGTKTSRDDGTFMSRMNKQVEDYSAWKEITPPQILPPVQWMKNCLDADFFTRMLFSCLTDADYLDTEAFMSDGKTERSGGDSIPVLTDRFDQYIQGWFPPKNELNAQRCQILRQCIRQGEGERGLYTLTVPTGGGKTVASLGFALHHAREKGLTRIVYVIPYTSIIEQTADTFRTILGENNVLEHHSGVLYDIAEDGEATPETIRMAKATENWDMPVIVTTAVRFFESIYSNRSSQCRKLHNLANSVILFDEAQMLPLSYLRPCISAISQLISNYGVTAVLCTATQPALEPVFSEFLPGQTATELCPPETFDDSLFRRVTFRRAGNLSWDAVAEQMLAMPQCLCVVNARKSAKELYERLGEEEGNFHLSTLMMPSHRRTVLKEIRQRLEEGLPCRVVSTSLIEAGVDVDFPAVFREEAGLDSVLQAAGRCNREGRRPLEESIVTIFHAEGRTPSTMQTAVHAGQEILENHEDISAQETIHAYFQTLFYLKGTDAQDTKGILRQIQEGTFPFQTIADQFHLIEERTKTVYIPVGEGQNLVAQLEAGEYSRSLFRKLGQYAVSVYEGHFNNLTETDDVRKIGDYGILMNGNLYDEHTGLSLEAEEGKGIFA